MPDQPFRARVPVEPSPLPPLTLENVVKAWVDWRLRPPSRPASPARADVEAWALEPPSTGIDPGVVARVTAAQVRRALQSLVDPMGWSSPEVGVRALRDPAKVRWANRQWRHLGPEVTEVSPLGVGHEAAAVGIEPGGLALKVFPWGLHPDTRDLLKRGVPDPILPVLSWGEYRSRDLGPTSLGYVVQPKASILGIGPRPVPRDVLGDIMRRLPPEWNKTHELYDLWANNIGMWQDRPWIVDIGNLVERIGPGQ